MEKEIYEQPEAVSKTIDGRIGGEDVLDNIYPFVYDKNQNIHILQRLFKIDKNSPAQKSEKWYLYRYNRITASDIASVFCTDGNTWKQHSAAHPMLLATSPTYVDCKAERCMHASMSTPRH